MPKHPVSPIDSIPDIRKYFSDFKHTGYGSAALEDAWIKGAEFLDLFSLRNNVLVFLWNPYTSKHLYMSHKLKPLLGLDPTHYHNDEFASSRLHPSHKHAMLLFNELCSACLFENVQHKGGLLFTLNYLHKNGHGEYVQLLQRTIAVESGQQAHPVFYLSLVQHIGHVKKRNSVGCAIRNGDNVSIHYYNPNTQSLSPPKTFTRREQKILELLALGYDTQKIAGKLFLSPLTVSTHRKNLIKKTDCIDTTGAVTFAKLINLIK